MAAQSIGLGQESQVSYIRKQRTQPRRFFNDHREVFNSSMRAVRSYLASRRRQDGWNDCKDVHKADRKENHAVCYLVLSSIFV